jgi:hypothetical protein
MYSIRKSRRLHASFESGTGDRSAHEKKDSSKHGEITSFDRIEGLGAMIIEEPTGCMTFSIKLIPEEPQQHDGPMGRILVIKPKKKEIAE